MTTAVCTLFEGDYHYGVAALANSLYHNGFRGRIYAGYRGPLPIWAKNSNKAVLGHWKNVSIFDIPEKVQIIFIPLSTDYHLTNYKPDFMLGLLNDAVWDVDALYYFDPDICIAEGWDFFEDWVRCGVALCENTTSPYSENHPRRIAWRNYFNQRGEDLSFKVATYVNGGLVGIRREHVEFIEKWKEIQELMAQEIGGLGKTKLNGGSLSYDKLRANYCFNATDQDALNAVIEASDQQPSILGKEAMDFQPGFAVAPHALGALKPWRRNYLISALSGIRVRKIDRVFWRDSQDPVKATNLLVVQLNRVGLAINVLTTRFYAK